LLSSRSSAALTKTLGSENAVHLHQSTGKKIFEYGKDDEMNKVVVLRHGESVWNEENRFTGWTDGINAEWRFEARTIFLTVANIAGV
jgi:hypothetical protein